MIYKRSVDELNSKIKRLQQQLIWLIVSGASLILCVFIYFSLPGPPFLETSIETFGFNNLLNYIISLIVLISLINYIYAKARALQNLKEELKKAQVKPGPIKNDTDKGEG